MALWLPGKWRWQAGPALGVPWHFAVAAQSLVVTVAAW